MKRQVEYFDLQPTLKISKFNCISSASLLACLPAIRPGCTRCRDPEISHNKGNGGGFTKILFRRRFTHCAMAIPFILHSFPCSLCIPYSKVQMSPKVTIAYNGFCLLRHTKTWLARDIISYSGTMFSRILAYTLLHRELRDYSLGQIAFAVFRALFAITQLFCHVSALLTSACKQA